MGGGWGSAEARLEVGPRFRSALEISAERMEQPQDRAGGGWGEKGLPFFWNASSGVPLGERYFSLPSSPPRQGGTGVILVAPLAC